MTDTQLLQSYLLRLADSDMILGQRLCELCGKAPALEEEMALMNVALDLVGQARNWYEYVAELEDQGRDADMLAFRRDAHEYRNLLLTEQPNGDYAVTMARQFFFDVWHYHTLQSLVNAPDERIAGHRGQGPQGSDLSPAPFLRVDQAPGRRHRGEPPPHAGRRGPALAIHR